MIGRDQVEFSGEFLHVAASYQKGGGFYHKSKDFLNVLFIYTGGV